MTAVVSQEYWDKLYEARGETVYDPDEVLFKDLFARHLRQGGDCFEVGCYPGNFLIYLGQQFGYTVHGIDATPDVTAGMPARLGKHGVRLGTFYHGDFLTFEPERTYDLVCSFGFVEHFANFEQVIEKHIRLLSPGGTLVLSCPNFRGLQYFLHRTLDRENLGRHVLRAMNLHAWRRVLQRHGMRVLHQGYYRTADFWVETPPPGAWARGAIAWVYRIARGIDRRVNWPNPLLSPYMISISRKGGRD
jgi:2-polyprenyl-3-methyl-5-hydroxy-6-metoxy-1,4-benzoquinol methylase